MRARRRWVEQHPERRQHLARPVISVGNLSMGGTGKSPVVAAIAQWLVDQGERPAILSRGYGRADARRRRGRGVRRRRACSQGVDRSGDEPLMLARQVPGAAVCVSPDRHLAGTLAERQLGLHGPRPRRWLSAPPAGARSRCAGDDDGGDPEGEGDPDGPAARADGCGGARAGAGRVRCDRRRRGHRSVGARDFAVVWRAANAWRARVVDRGSGIGDRGSGIGSGQPFWPSPALPIRLGSSTRFAIRAGQSPTRCRFPIIIATSRADVDRIAGSAEAERRRRRVHHRQGRRALRGARRLAVLRCIACRWS